MLLFLFSCKNQEADLVLINGMVHTVRKDGEITQAIAIRDGKIAAVGTTNEILSEFQADSTIDLKGKAVYPGFIDAHCHFVGYAQGLFEADLVGTTSWSEVLSRVDSFSQNVQTEWIQGRGWDQNDWNIKDFPDNRDLNRLFPNIPVILKRIDGHAAIANSEALKRAGIDGKTVVAGGIIQKRRGNPTGILIDNAVELVEDVIPPPSNDMLSSALLRAEKNLFSVGLTTVDDAGLDLRIINLLDSLHQSGDLKIRVYAMANPTEENFDRFLKSGPYKTDRLNVRSFKLYADGALGSRGAALLQPYHDKENRYGLILKPLAWYRETIAKIAESKFQVNTHCIGDSANRMILRIYGNNITGEQDRRWRIEHAQVVHPSDLNRFRTLKVIPSVQPKHLTSDMYWAKDRLGNSRIKTAYAYKSLYDLNKLIAFGSDFPVEGIDPLQGFYAAVSRKDLDGFPFEGFQPDQKVSRETALYAMTRGAAFSNFEEDEKGSLKVGHFADIVVLDQDIVFVDEKEIPKTKVLMTLLNGEIVYSR